MEKFKPYEKMTSKLRNWDQDAAEAVTWVATPKIHGTNMSVTVRRSGTGVDFARRHGFLGKDTAFMGYGDVLPTLAPWRDFLDDFPASVQAVTVFGEFFGGSYPGFASHHHGRPIQTGVHYSPTKRFVAFDIRVTDGTVASYVDFPDTQALCSKHAVPCVAPCCTGTFAEVLEWAKTHAADDVNPAWYQAPDLPVIPGNAGEGWVVRPCRELHSSIEDTRVMIKVKNPMFSESARVSGVGRVKADPGVSSIVTATRVANVLTKELPESVVFANFAHLVDLVVQDAHADDEVDTDEDPVVTRKTAGVLIRRYIETATKK